MYRKCTTEISVRHQKQVTDALLDLMGQMPYEDITVTQLCQRAGVTRRVFYHLFSNMTGALYAMIDHMILGMEGHAPEIQSEPLRFFYYWKEHRRFLDALWENELPGLMLERMINCVLEEDFNARYWMKSQGWSENSREVVVYGLSGLMGLLYTWYVDGFRKTPEEMAALVEQVASPLLTK